MAKVKNLINENPNINLNFSREYNGTPLACAVLGKHKDIIEFLIASGADVNYAGEIGTESLLHLAAQKAGCSNIIKILLKAGADPNKKTAYSLLSLNLAVQNRDLLAVKALLEASADINATDNYDRTALIYAAQIGDKRIISYLISQKSIILDHSDIRGYDALMYAVSNKHTAVVEQLLKAGFRIEKPMNGIGFKNSPLQISTNKKIRKMLSSAFEKQEKSNSK